MADVAETTRACGSHLSIDTDTPSHSASSVIAGAPLVRPLVASDRVEWDPLWQGYLNFFGEILSDEVTEMTFHRLTETGPHRGLVAEVDGKVVGLVHYVFHNTTWAVLPTCYLEDLYVSSEVRGGGVGRALIEALYRIADEEGAGTVYWFTHETNARARVLYDKIGQLSSLVKYERASKTT